MTSPSLEGCTIVTLVAVALAALLVIDARAARISGSPSTWTTLVRSGRSPVSPGSSVPRFQVTPSDVEVPPPASTTVSPAGSATASCAFSSAAVPRLPKRIAYRSSSPTETGLAFSVTAIISGAEAPAARVWNVVLAAARALEPSVSETAAVAVRIAPSATLPRS